MMKQGRLMLVLLLILILGTVAAAEEGHQDMAAVSEQDGWRNYILVIDNSGSNEVDTTSTGAATDPTGLRFEAANALYGALQNDFDRIGVIVFSGGEEYCRTYGPVDRGSASAWSMVGQYLNKAANATRSPYTDINYALRQALQMASSFSDGETSIILLSDGANDLTNTQTALTDPQNLAANEATIQTVSGIGSRENVNFYVVALTAGGQSNFRERFFGFINRLAEAGGGYWTENGMMSNVMEASADGLTENFLHLIGLGEPVRTVTPSIESFVVPYDSVTEATVTITFAMGDRDNLDEISLIDPFGAVYRLWSRTDGIAYSNPMFEVSESKSSITLKVFEPAAGEWKVEVIGVPGTQIEEYINMSQNVRAALSMDSDTTVGSEAEFRVWLQRYVGEAYEDITDPAIYRQSNAFLRLTAPQSGTATEYAMTLDGNGYVIRIPLTEAGAWTAQVTVSNSILEKKIDHYSFQVVEIGEVRDVVLNIEPECDLIDGMRYVDRNAQTILFYWMIDGEYDEVSAVVRIPETNTVLAEIRNEYEWSVLRSQLQDDTLYEMQISVVPQYGTQEQAVIRSFPFRLYPAPAWIEGLTLNVNGGTTGTDGVCIVESRKVGLTWDVQGDVESFLLRTVLPDGTETEQEYPASQRSEQLVMQQDGTYAVYLTAVPRYDDGTTRASAELQIRAQIPSFMERVRRNLGLIIGIAAGVLAAAFLGWLWWWTHRPKILGHLQLSLTDIYVMGTFVFGKKSSNRLFEGVPISSHKQFAAWISRQNIDEDLKKLLSGMTLKMTKTDNQGRIQGEFVGVDVSQGYMQGQFGGAGLNQMPRHGVNKTAILINAQGQSSIYVASGDAPWDIELKVNGKVFKASIRYTDRQSGF